MSATSLPSCLREGWPKAGVGLRRRYFQAHPVFGCASATPPASGRGKIVAAALVSLALSACSTVQSEPIAPAAPAPVAAPAVPMGQQWLYGSAEGAIAARQTFGALVSYAQAKAAARPADSVIIDEATGRPVPCGDKPLAAVFDADETLIWNVGSMRWFAMQGQDFDPAIWDQWEKTGTGKALAMPGALEAMAALRAAGITPIANTNRSTANAKGSEATLAAAGLGDFKHGETLFLMGDDADGSSKDMRRAMIAARWCVVAMAGDQLGDFRNAFNKPELPPLQRRALAMAAPYDALWGNGWFLFANPVYGPSIRGGFEDIFPAETHWEPQP
jgi:5'-nucleotidase (lipoprotein e(P4) family)